MVFFGLAMRSTEADKLLREEGDFGRYDAVWHSLELVDMDLSNGQVEWRLKPALWPNSEPSLRIKGFDNPSPKFVSITFRYFSQEGTICVTHFQGTELAPQLPIYRAKIPGAAPYNGALSGRQIHELTPYFGVTFHQHTSCIAQIT